MPIIVATQGQGGAMCGSYGPSVVASVPAPPQAVVVTQGPQGPAASASDYGFVRYDEGSATPIVLQPNAPLPFGFNQPFTVTDDLKPPFSGHAYLGLDNATILARKVGDSYLVRVRLSVVASQAGGTFNLNLFVTGNTTSLQGANSTKSEHLNVAAGVSQRIDELYQLFPGTGFVANGALFQMMATVPAVVTPESLYITPVVAGP